MNSGVNIKAVSTRRLAAAHVQMRFFFTLLSIVTGTAAEWLSVKVLWCFGCFVLGQLRSLNPILILLFQLCITLGVTLTIFLFHNLVASIRWRAFSNYRLGYDLFLRNFMLSSDSGPDLLRPMLILILHELAISLHWFRWDGRRAMSMTVQISLDTSLFSLLLAEISWCWWYRFNSFSVILFLL